MDRKKLDAINLLVERGHKFVRQLNHIKGCDSWLRAWDLVKQVKSPEMRLTEAFSHVYYHYLILPTSEWTIDLMFELHNAGLDDPHYHELRLDYIDDYFKEFPDELKVNGVSFLRGKGEAFWLLGRREEAEAQFAAIIKDYPDDAWGYIGWSDHYYFRKNPAKDYAAACAILLQGLERPTLIDRWYALDRLHSVYEKWGKDEEAARVAIEMENVRNQKPVRPVRRSAKPTHNLERLPMPDEFDALMFEEVRQRPQLSWPCWCGSGKKYKKCHWLADQS